MAEQARQVARIRLTEEQRRGVVRDLGGELEQVPDTIEVVRKHESEIDDVSGYALFYFMVPTVQAETYTPSKKEQLRDTQEFYDH